MRVQWVRGDDKFDETVQLCDDPKRSAWYRDTEDKKLKNKMRNPARAKEENDAND
jgi:hypothetical protein